MRMNIIPQNLNQSDRIGKFTFQELGVVAVGVILFFINILFFNLFFALFSAIPIGIGVFLFLKMKVNDLPLYQYLMIYLIYKTQPKKLIYRTDNRKVIENEELIIEFIEHENIFKNENEVQEQSKRKTNKKSKRNIEKDLGMIIGDDEDFFN